MVYRNKSSLLMAVIIIALLLLIAYASMNAAPPSVVAPQVRRPPPDDAAGETVIEIEIWTKSVNNEDRWRVDGPLKATEMVTEFKINPTVVAYQRWEQLTADFLEAAEAGRGPDIIYLGPNELSRWRRAGYLHPFDSCRAAHAEFDEVLNYAWLLSTRQEQVWGAPFDADVKLLFFNKQKLKEMGWSDARVADLPQAIEQGRFTLEDVIAVAKQAIAQGVIEPGVGFWYRPALSSEYLLPYLAYGGRVYEIERQKLMINRAALRQWYTFQRRLIDEGLTPAGLLDHDWNQGAFGRSIYHDTVAHGRVLFWIGKLNYWSGWTTEYTPDLGGEAYLRRFTGFAFFPAPDPNRRGSLISGASFFALVSEQASGRTRQDAACALLAKMTIPEINTLNAVTKGRLGVLKSQLAGGHYLTSELSHMVKDGQMLPPVEMYGSYFEVLWRFMREAENGTMSPEAAATAAVEELQQELGEALIIE